MIKEQWKNYNSDEENLRENLNYLFEDYVRLVNFWEEHKEDKDDATWVHVDEVREERVKLEEEVEKLKEALHKRNEEYLELAEKYKSVLNGDKPKKKLKKVKRVRFEDDDFPF